MSGGGFPRFVALKSNVVNKHVVTARSGGKLGASGGEVFSPLCKFELERATTPGKESWYNVRSCWNNRYWVKESSSSINIKAGASEPNEDTSSWSCTLVQPAFVDNGRTTITLKLAQSNKLIGTSSVAPGHALQESSSSTTFLVINSQSLVIFPKAVTFKGEATDRYLATRMLDYPGGGKKPFLKFDTTDNGHPSVVQEVFPNEDGSIMIRSREHGYFWMAGARNWIVAMTGSPIPDHLRPYCTFVPVRVDDETIALRNVGHNNFCTTLYEGHLDSCLNASIPTITRDARMSVHEAVLERMISNVRYRLEDARIYGETILSMAEGEAINETDASQTKTLTFKRKETVTKSWERSVFSSLTVRNSITAGIPKIVSAKIEITATVELSLKWSETVTTTTELESSLEATVPPRSRIVVTQVAIQGHCDVPFSYSVHDRLANGDDSFYEMDDGVYKGANPYKFQYRTTQHPLPPA